MTTWPILSVTTFLPAVGAILVYLLARGGDETANRTARWIALWTTLITFAVSLILVARFDPASTDFQFVEKASWLATGITYHMGVDGISLPLIILTTAIMPLCIIASWKSVTQRVGEYMMAFLILETLMVGTFSALDLVLFYLFFEGGLIPMFLIIGVWGGPRRVYASFKFFLYTFLGSVLMLLAIMALYWNAGTTDIPTLMHTAVPRSLQTWAWLAFFASFAVKMPMWPVHTWLPDAHVEAPTAGSVILAGILLKTAAYGLLRFALPLFPNASAEFAPIAQWLGVFAIIYGALLSFAQTDIKRLVAYSSVSHMGFVLIAIYSGSQIALQGAVVQMVAHGLSAAALFILCGQLYERVHTRDLRQMGGIWARMPWLPAISLFFAAAALGLPGTGNFVGEFLILIGSFPGAPWIVVLAATGLVLGSVYALAMIHRAYFGPVQQDAPLPGLKARELAMVLGLAALLILLGVYPQPVLDTSAASMHGVQQWMAGALDQLASGR